MFKEYNQGQNYLIPTSFEEQLGEGHQVFTLNDIINNLDLTVLFQSYNNKNGGSSAYNPSMLLKVIFYSYMNGVFSSRQIADKLKSDLAFMYLSGNNKPDFRTINRFRKERLIAIEEIFVEVVGMLKKMKLIKFGTVSIDGTKIYADASDNNNYTIKSIDKTIKSLLDDAETIDNYEDSIYGDRKDDIPEELKTKEGRKKKLKEIKQKLNQQNEIRNIVEEEIEKKKEQGIKQDSINLTDKDSRLFKMKHGDFDNGYNIQIITENSYILTTSISNNANDINELIPTFDNFYLMHKRYPKIGLADKGYSKTDNFVYLEKNKIDGYITPHQKPRINLEDYLYDKVKDQYIDKEGNVYRLTGYEWKEGYPKEKRRIGKNIANKDAYDSEIYCYKDSNRKRKCIKINRERHYHYKKTKLKLETDVGKELTKKRSTDVEPVFGNIKRNLGFERFSLRGLIGVQIEWNIISIVHNLKKLMIYQTI